MKWIIDTDPGIDDASAIITAVNSGALDILGITCVHGNVGLEYTTRNALKLIELMDVGIPVYGGASRPILQKPEHASYVHGTDGFGNTFLSEPNIKLEPIHAVDFIIEAAYADDKLGLLTLGPLTNVALAIAKDRSLEDRIDRIVMMAGTSRARGNTSPVAEFNVFADPEAAAVVFDTGIPITMVPWETCLDTLLGPDTIRELRKSLTPVGQAFSNAMEFTLKGIEASMGQEFLVLCDLIAACVAIDPSVVKEKASVTVRVETCGRYSRGLTVIDERNIEGAEPNVTLCLACDREQIAGMFLNAINHQN
ncbi:MAG TPA: nucleoside hydrolase [Bacillota bacterium]|nr:nucleoside hydrolase [Candidatus Fermentithermobacillaceae bacterium]HOB30872.1 nucleoside hydrolase [Bacillota bacterium]HOK64669.1 nucleoside hydrolase [Bacillota bacterium]HOL12200.1 nucleoside hydrolase [Bacillota bacterium]HOQ02238.1 nucleoside hydrolase [Bacillota bacterium]